MNNKLSLRKIACRDFEKSIMTNNKIKMENWKPLGVL